MTFIGPPHLGQRERSGESSVEEFYCHPEHRDARTYFDGDVVPRHPGLCSDPRVEALREIWPKS
jgi:hypothetical protein